MDRQLSHEQRRYSGYNGSIYGPSSQSKLPCFDSYLRRAGQLDTASKTSPDLHVETRGFSPGQPTLLPLDLVASSTQSYHKKYGCAVQPEPGAVVTNTTSVHKGFAILQHDEATQEQDPSGQSVCYAVATDVVGPAKTSSDTMTNPWPTKAEEPCSSLGEVVDKNSKLIRRRKSNNSRQPQCPALRSECVLDPVIQSSYKRVKLGTNNTPADTMSVCMLEKHPRPCRSSPTQPGIPSPNHTSAVTSSKSPNSTSELALPTIQIQQGGEVQSIPSETRIDAGHHIESADNDVYQSSAHSAEMDVAHQPDFGPDIDPFAADEQLTRHYVDTFLEHFNVSMFRIFPRHHLIVWMADNTSKSLAERMVLYAVMACATIYSNHRLRTEHRTRFKSLVRRHIGHVGSCHSLQLVHALLLLAVTDLADGEYQKGFHTFVRCAGVVTALQLNVEETIRENERVYDFSRAMTAECRRRTYWAASYTEICIGLEQHSLRILSSADVFLNMPCASRLYESDQIPDLVPLDPGSVLPGTLTAQDHPSVANAVYLIGITSIMSEILRNVWRCQTLRRMGLHNVSDQSTREKLHDRLREWAQTYDHALRARQGQRVDTTTSHRDSDTRAGDPSRTSAGIKMLFHYCHMELNGRVFHRDLSEGEILMHAKTATAHAIEALRLAQHVLSRKDSGVRDYCLLIGSPVTGYAVYTAIDTVTAAGRVRSILEPQSTIMQLVYSGLELLEELGSQWASASFQHIQAQERIQIITDCAQAAIREQKKHFECTDSMVRREDRDFDLIYGSDRAWSRQAAESTSSGIKDTEIYVIDTKTRS